MYCRRGSDPVKVVMVSVTMYLMYNSWSMSKHNIRDAVLIHNTTQQSVNFDFIMSSMDNVFYKEVF